MRNRVTYVIVVMAILAVGALYLSGYLAYQYSNGMSGKLVRSPSPEWSTLYFDSPSGETVAEFNFSTSYAAANNTEQGAGFGFQLWHAPGFKIQLVNLTFSIGPSPAKVWVTQFSYDTGGYAPLDFEKRQFH